MPLRRRKLRGVRAGVVFARSAPVTYAFRAENRIVGLPHPWKGVVSRRTSWTKRLPTAFATLRGLRHASNHRAPCPALPDRPGGGAGSFGRDAVLERGADRRSLHRQ